MPMTNKKQRYNNIKYTDQYLTALLRKTEIVLWKFKYSKKNNKNNSDKRENKPAPLYTCFAIMFIGYAVLFVVKARGKK